MAAPAEGDLIFPDISVPIGPSSFGDMVLLIRSTGHSGKVWAGA